MADEGSERETRRMDLNLYLGLPRSPRPRSLDLGSDLALSSLPLSTSSTTEESPTPVEMPSTLDPSSSHAPYSPSHTSISPDPSILPIDSASNHEYTPYFPIFDRYSPLYGPIPSILPEPEGLTDPLPAPQETDEPASSDGQRYDPRLPSYIPLEDPQETGDELPWLPTARRLVRPLTSSMYRPPPRSPSPPLPMYSVLSDLFGRDDESSSRHDELIESPELRFRRLIESSHRLRLRRIRSDIDRRPASPGAEELMLDIMRAQRSVEPTGKHKVPVEAIPEESSEDEEKEEKKTANFECNICFDLAREPVVTSCGHLFCWPCLFQWLHVHSDHKECPVCKGEVTDANVTPIYGRGDSSESSDGKKASVCDGKKPANSSESGIKIPPRPHGNRIESFRQQIRPISRRLGEGITNSWRRFMSHQMRSRMNRPEGHHGVPHGRSRQQIFNRMRRSMLSEESNGGEPEESIPHSERDGSRSDLWHQFSMYNYYANDRLAAISADIGRMVSSNNRYGASTSATNPPSPERPVARVNVGSSSAAQDQASVSSTTAVIQEDTAEPNSAGSSRSYRRRGRSSTSGSLDVDGGVLHPRKRRTID